ncbi:hypothetical protein JNB88_31290 [Rhizobium cauense]|uniref:DUF6894 family protein n=1 Tax=Rhizobium cauense TaxID=1166683 RepID=UPI001C6F2D3A|nr:hypothetical protein [Rhizobium cauense]MBW9118100.1 hypothetical protein [Rhizobium cauense]
MPAYFFQIIDRAGGPTESSFEFDSEEAAIEEARRALTEIAADGLPKGPLNMLSVEVFDEHKRPLREIRLILEEIDKAKS